MSNPIQARYSTDPAAIHYACTHGISSNPMYMNCDCCGNAFCEIRAARKLIRDWQRIDDFHNELDSIYDEKEREKFLRRKKSQEILDLEMRMQLEAENEERYQKHKREQAKKPKMTPEEQAFEIKVGLTIWAILIFLAWLAS